MITNKEATVSLRIASKILNCTEISSILNWQPVASDLHSIIQDAWHSLMMQERQACC